MRTSMPSLNPDKIKIGYVVQVIREIKGLGDPGNQGDRGAIGRKDK